MEAHIVPKGYLEILTQVKLKLQPRRVLYEQPGIAVLILITVVTLSSIHFASTSRVPMFEDYSYFCNKVLPVLRTPMRALERDRWGL